MLCECMFCLHVFYVYVPDVYRGQERALGTLELEWQIVVSCHVGTRH